MINARGVATAAVAAAMVLLALGGAAFAQTHALWPDDWNNWNDPALWVTVGNPGNAADTRYSTSGFGAVPYTYRIGKFEVTTGQYTAFLNAVAATDTYGLYSTHMAEPALNKGCNIQRSGSAGGYTYSVASEWANRPVGYVSWGDSARFSNWLSNGQPTGVQDASTTEDGSYYLNGATSRADLMAATRKTAAQGGRYYIPTEDEWYKAAYYNGASGVYYDFPTGSNKWPSNVLGTPIDMGNNATYYNAMYTIGSPYYRTEVGAHENSDSPYGTFDQAGNVWEWNETIIYGSNRILRGGSFEKLSDLLQASAGGWTDPTSESRDLGFRVSEVPEPAMMALLALGGVGILIRRWGMGR